MIRRLICCLPVAVLLLASPLAAQSETSDSLSLGRKFTQWFIDGHADSLWNVMDEGMRGRVGSIETIENMMDQAAEQVGEETDVVSETAHPTEDGQLEYRRVSTFDMAPERIVWIWRTNADGIVTRAAIRPESQVPPVEAEK